MNGAESLVRTLVKGGVEVCFANPGTSEMHFVGALDRVEGMRCVLGLFEGVCSGAADGYYRMTDKPASTLLHLGPGLANAAANLHNAKKAGSGIVNIVGEHALYHIKYDTPLTADIEGIARPFSHWVKTSPTSKTVAADGAAAIQAARVAPGQIATLILPADTAWTEADGVAETPETPPPQKPANEAVVAAAKALQGRAVGHVVPGWPRLACAGPRAGRQDRRQDRLQGAGGGRHGAHRARRGPRARAAPALRGRDGARDAEGHQAHGAVRRQGAGGLLRLSRQAVGAGAGGLRGLDPLPGRGRSDRLAGGARRRARRAERKAGRRRSPSGRTVRPASSRSKAWAPRWARPCPRAPSWSTNR